MQSVSKRYTRRLAVRGIGAIRKRWGMSRLSEGFTVVEVTIFLGLSGVLIASSLTFISGRDGHTRFSQGMRDAQSKFEDWFNDIPTGFSNGAGSAHCQSTGSGSKVQIDTGPANPANPNEVRGDCIYLGKAIQITDSDTTNWPGGGRVNDQETLIYAYSVFGTRTYTPSGEDERPVANLVEAQPFAAINTGNCASCSGSADLTEVYKIGGAAKLLKVMKSSGIPADNNSHLAGFYLSFNRLQATGTGSASITAYQYRLSGNRAPANSSTAGPLYKQTDSCISMDYGMAPDCSSGPVVAITSPDKWPEPLTDWEMCFGNDYNSDTAVLTISAVSGTNVSTKLEFKECS